MLAIILSKLLHDVAAHIAVLFLHPLCGRHALLGRHFFTTLTHQLLHELCKIFTCDWNALYAATDHIPVHQCRVTRHGAIRYALPSFEIGQLRIFGEIDFGSEILQVPDPP